MHGRERKQDIASGDHPHDRRLRMRNDIDGNHKHLATIVLFLKYKCATQAQ